MSGQPSRLYIAVMFVFFLPHEVIRFVGFRSSVHSRRLKVHGANIYVFLKSMRRDNRRCLFLSYHDRFFVHVCYGSPEFSLLSQTCLNNQANEAFAQFQEHGSKSSRSGYYHATQRALVRIKMKKKKRTSARPRGAAAAVKEVPYKTY